ncbi:MAG: hypothetical protein ACTSYA_03445 [Candidatus Kariarchaeaceae archaeon]
MMLIISIHPSIRPEEMGSELEIECSDMTICEAIWVALDPYKDFKYRIFKNNKLPRPDILFISSGIELRTTERIHENCLNYEKVRLIPVTHGG